MAVIKGEAKPRETLRDLLKWAIEQLEGSYLVDYHFTVGDGKPGEQRITFDFELRPSENLIKQCKPPVHDAAPS